MVTCGLLTNHRHGNHILMYEWPFIHKATHHEWNNSKIVSVSKVKSCLLLTITDMFSLFLIYELQWSWNLYRMLR